MPRHEPHRIPGLGTTFTFFLLGFVFVSWTGRLLPAARCVWGGVGGHQLDLRWACVHVFSQFLQFRDCVSYCGWDVGVVASERLVCPGTLRELGFCRPRVWRMVRVRRYGCVRFSSHNPFDCRPLPFVLPHVEFPHHPLILSCCFCCCFLPPVLCLVLCVLCVVPCFTLALVGVSATAEEAVSIMEIESRFEHGHEAKGGKHRRRK